MKARVFLDASFWIAYRDARQENSSRAKELVQQLFRDRRHFVITLPVFCEIHAHFARHAARRKIIVADFWNNPLVQIEPLTHTDQEQALELIGEHEDKTYPLCDVLSFVAMRRLGLKQVATFDEHFRQFGEFEILS